jgi:4-hydroxybenzoate polyprenyltransferase
MTSKIDIRMIVEDHFSTFKDEGTQKVSPYDYAIMLGGPGLLAIILVLFGFSIGDANVGALISVFAIFAGLLFNVLVLIYSFSDVNSDGKKGVRDRLLRQSFANISYSILVSLTSVVVLAALLFVGGILQSFLEAIVIFLSANFVLSLLMVLKRIHVLLRDKFAE